MQPDDWYWRRPDPGDPPGVSGSGWTAPTPPEGMASRSPDPDYPAPPPMTAPPAGWRPERITEPHPPRALPEQDHARVDDEEARARTVTQLVAIVASIIMLVALCAVCGRVAL